MTLTDIRRHRLHNLQITQTTFTQPHEIVQWLVAMQAQEYAFAKWAIGLRLPGITDAIVEAALNEGAILRTHLMRPTWHFVTPTDIRWLLKLTAPRVHAFNAYYYRLVELTDNIFKRSHQVLIKALQGGKYLDRVQIKAALEKAKIATDGLRLIPLLMHAELEGIICSGPRHGKQFTYALLEERVPAVPAITREEALATLVKRYFLSRGPATLSDFVWWSGLTMKDAKEGVAMCGKDLIVETIKDQEYLWAPTATTPGLNNKATFLLPDYDEYGISYKERSVLYSPGKTLPLEQPGVTRYSKMLVVDGTVAGTWKPVIKNKSVAVDTAFFSPVSEIKKTAVEKAVKRYTAFMTPAKPKKK